MVANDSSSVSLQKALANAQNLLGINRPQAALDKLSKEFAKFPNHPDLFFAAGLCYLHMDQFEKADSYFKTAIIAAPDMLEAKSLLAITRVALKDRKTALKLAQEVVEQAPNDDRSHYILAVVYQSLYRTKEAIAAANKALALAPNDVSIHNLLAELHLAIPTARKEIDKAERYIALGLNAAPNDLELITRHSELLAYRGKNYAAMNRYLSAAELNPQDSQIRQEYLQQFRVLFFWWLLASAGVLTCLSIFGLTGAATARIIISTIIVILFVTQSVKLYRIYLAVGRNTSRIAFLLRNPYDILQTALTGFQVIFYILVLILGQQWGGRNILVVGAVWLASLLIAVGQQISMIFVRPK